MAQAGKYWDASLEKCWAECTASWEQGKAAETRAGLEGSTVPTQRRAEGSDPFLCSTGNLS